MRSLTRFSALFGSFVLAVNATPVKPAREIGNVFAVYPGWNMVSGDEPNMPINGQTEKQCLEACHTSPTCIAYAYMPYNSNGGSTSPGCWLKDTIVLSTFQQDAFDTSSALLGGCGTFSPVGPTTCFSVTA